MKISCRNFSSWHATVAILVLILISGSAGPSEADVPVCGNGLIETGEACDDGNLIDGDGCTSACAVEQQCYDAGNVFSFFAWSDAYPGGSDTGIQRVLSDAVNASTYPVRVIPRFWFGVGDIPFMYVSFGRLDELNGAISDSRYPFACGAGNRKFPYFVALGNHDVDGTKNITPELQYDYWSNYVGPRLPTTLVGIRNFRWGPSNGYDYRTSYSFDYKNAHFIVVNQYHGDPAYPTADPIACIRPDLYSWIDQDLAETNMPIRFVFGHEPAWSYCSNLGGYGGEFCPIGHIDNLDPPRRPRIYSTTGDWVEPYGRHWGDSLDDQSCPPGSRDQFWAMLSRHKVIAHFTGHTHTYSGRLIKGDGTRRNDIPAYEKQWGSFQGSDGVWEINTAMTHTTAGALYVLATVNDNAVTFESYDQKGKTEPFQLIESWTVYLQNVPVITSPADGAIFVEGMGITVSASFDVEPGAGTMEVAFYAGTTRIGVATMPPYTILWNPTAGTYNLTAVATDSSGFSPTSNPVTITVQPFLGNYPPVLSPVGDKTVDEGTTLTFIVTANDPDPGQTLTYVLSGNPPGMMIDPANGVFSWTPTSAQVGSYTVTIRVTDNGTPVLFDEEVITVTVNAINHPPVLEPIGNRTVNAGTMLSFTAAATDPDPGQTMVYSLILAPAGAAIDPASGAFTWTPSSSQAGTHSFTIRVTDNGAPALFDEESITVTVEQAPPPSISRVVHGVAALEAGSASTMVTIPQLDVSKTFLLFGGSFNDANPMFSQVTGALTNGTTITFQRDSGSGAPGVNLEWYVAEFTGGMSVQRGTANMGNASNRVLNVLINPVDPSRAFPLISFRGSGTTYAEKDFVKARITSPTNLELKGFSSGLVEWQIVEYDKSVVQTGEVSFGSTETLKTAQVPLFDPAKSWLIISWMGYNGPGATMGMDQKLFRGTITDGTTLTFSRIGKGLPSELTWYLVEFLDDTTVQKGTSNFGSNVTAIDVPLSAGVDPSQSIVAATGYWNRGGATSYASNDNPGVATVTMNLNSWTNLRLVRGVTGASTAEIDWSVVEFHPSNNPPVLWPIGNQTAAVGTTLTFTASATDPDPGQTLTYELLESPAGATIDPVRGVFNWIPNSSQVGTHIFTVRVVDNGTPALSDEEVITVTVNATPP